MALTKKTLYFLCLASMLILSVVAIKAYNFEPADGGITPTTKSLVSNNYIIVDDLIAHREGSPVLTNDTIIPTCYKVVKTDTANYVRMHYRRNDTTFHFLISTEAMDEAIDNL